MRVLFDLSNPGSNVADAIVAGFDEEIELYLYERFGD